MTGLDYLREIAQRNNFVVLDTETTGVGNSAEVCQIALIDHTGQTLMNEFVCPTKPIPDKVIAVHGITSEMVADAPPWSDSYKHLMRSLTGRDLFIYGYDFDTRLIIQTCFAHGIESVDFRQHIIYGNGICVMDVYADYWGEWNPHYRNNKWQKLTAACAQQGLPVLETAHSALSDCQMTLNLIRHLENAQ